MRVVKNFKEAIFLRDEAFLDNRQLMTQLACFIKQSDIKLFEKMDESHGFFFDLIIFG